EGPFARRARRSFAFGSPGAPGTAHPAASLRRASHALPSARPDLEQRVRWLAALHPALAERALEGGWAVDGSEPLETFASAELAEWLRTVAALPAGSTLANVCEALRDQAPALVERLQREAAAVDWALGTLTIEEARVEFDAALVQLHDRSLARQIDELVATGMQKAEDRERYQELMAKRRRP